MEWLHEFAKGKDFSHAHLRYASLLILRFPSAIYFVALIQIQRVWKRHCFEYS